MTDEGYLQIKIRELQNKIEELEQRIDSLNSIAEKNRISIEEKDKSIQDNIIKMKELLDKVDSSNLESLIKEKIKNIIEQSTNKVIDKTMIKLDSWETNFQEQINQIINTAESNLGTKLMDHTASLMHGFTNMLFCIIKETCDKEKLLKMAPLMFPIRNAYNAEDMIFILDFKDDKLFSSMGKDVVEKFCKQYKVENTELSRDKFVRIKVKEC